MGEEMGRNGLFRIFTLVSAAVMETSGRKRGAGFFEHAHFSPVFFFPSSFFVFNIFSASLLPSPTQHHLHSALSGFFFKVFFSVIYFLNLKILPAPTWTIN